MLLFFLQLFLPDRFGVWSLSCSTVRLGGVCVYVCVCVCALCVYRFIFHQRTGSFAMMDDQTMLLVSVPVSKFKFSAWVNCIESNVGRARNSSGTENAETGRSCRQTGILTESWIDRQSADYKKTGRQYMYATYKHTNIQSCNMCMNSHRIVCVFLHMNNQHKYLHP